MSQFIIPFPILRSTSWASSSFPFPFFVQLCELVHNSLFHSTLNFVIPFSTWVWTSPFTPQLNEPLQGYLYLPLKSPLSSLISHLRFVIYSPCPRIVAPSQAGGSERDVASEEYLIYSSKDQIKRFSDSFSIIFTISLANSLRIHWNATPILTFYWLHKFLQSTDRNLAPLWAMDHAGLQY